MKPGETTNDSRRPLENIVFSRMVAFAHDLQKNSTGHCIWQTLPKYTRVRYILWKNYKIFMQKLLKITKTRQKCDQNCPEEPQRYPRGLQRGSWGLQMTPKRPKRYPNGAPEGPKGLQKEPERVQKGAQKGTLKWSKRGSHLGGPYFLDFDDSIDPNHYSGNLS